MTPSLANWLTYCLDDPGPFRVTSISGGNSNETAVLKGRTGSWILRRPPETAISTTANNLRREARILAALSDTDVPAPRAVAFTDDPAVAPKPVLVMELLPGDPLTDNWPTSWSSSARSAHDVGQAVVSALALLHRVVPSSVGLGDFGRPEGYLERQAGRWRAQYEANRVRDLPAFDRLADWLETQRPEQSPTGIVHGDFRLDNCILTPDPVRVRGIIDWELATLGDPLVDLGLFLAFWGSDRPAPLAMPSIQAVSRVPGAPSRADLAKEYAALTGRSVDAIDYYIVLASYKLAAIVEGAYARYVAGDVASAYAERLEEDVPRLLAEAEHLTGTGSWAVASRGTRRLPRPGPR
jgi:aminoglycoside phosphotransferase (APT) family kinase protein